MIWYVWKTNSLATICWLTTGPLFFSWCWPINHRGPSPGRDKAWSTYIGNGKPRSFDLFWRGKSTISMGHGFNSKVLKYQGVKWGLRLFWTAGHLRFSTLFLLTFSLVEIASHSTQMVSQVEKWWKSGKVAGDLKSKYLWFSMVPSDHSTVCYWKSPLLIGKSTITGPFSIVMLVYQRVFGMMIHSIQQTDWFEANKELEPQGVYFPWMGFNMWNKQF